MKDPWDDPARLRKARRLLKEMLPRARAAARRAPDEAVFKPNTAVAEAMLPYLREDRLEGVFIYQTAPTRWYADVSFFDENNIRRVAGTAYDAPLPSRAAAEAQALTLLTLAIRNAATPLRAPEEIAFEYHGFQTRLPRAIVDEIRRLLERAPDAFTTETISQRLEAITRELFSDGVTEDAIQALSKPDRVQLLTICIIAYLLGFVRWPERKLEDDILDEDSPLSKLQ